MKHKKEIFPRRGRLIFKQEQSGYGRIEVGEVIEHNELLRLLTVDGVRESAAYMEDLRHFDLVFKYTQDLVTPLQHKDDIKEVLLLGGAGFSIPKYIIHYFHDVHLDVVEINPRMYQLAMQYFYLDELYTKYRLTENRRMEVFIEDANDYIKKTNKKYDLIINDAYVANRIDDELLGDSRVKLIKNHLTPGGIYIINLITAVHGPSSMPGILEWEILKRHFNHTDMYPCKKEAGPLEKQNCILIASDEAISTQQVY